MAKKDPYKFTIQFNEGDPSHLQIAEMLNQQGRRKAQFIVNAVMHYIHCSETPNIPEPALPDIDVIERVVLRILEEQGNNSNASANHTQAKTSRPIKSEEIDFGDTAELLGNEGVAAITKTMASFRK